MKWKMREESEILGILREKLKRIDEPLVYLWL
jgi:hypothetical protein